MEWYVDAENVEDVRQSRHEFAAYLSARAAAGSDIGAAEVVYSELVGNVHRHVGGAAWVRLDWVGDCPVLAVRDLGPGFIPAARATVDPDSPGGRGLYLVRRLAGEITVSHDATGTCVSVNLPVRRRGEPARSYESATLKS